MTLTLPELQQLRQQWLNMAQAAEYPETFVLIAEKLGENHILPGGRKRVAKHFSAPCQYGIAHLLTWEKTGKLDIATQQFETNRVVVVYLSRPGNDLWSGLRVMYWITPCQNSDDLLFIPGQWVEVLLPFAETARQEAKKAQETQEDFERLRLEKLLLIGEKI